MKKLVLSLSAILTICIALLLNGCGGGGGSTSSTPTPTPSTANEWTWMSGSSTRNAIGIYGTQGVGANTNVPGSRYSASSWTDNSGNLWLFGGDGFDSAGQVDFLNDLWEYVPTSKTWTWVNGSKTVDALGVYGTEGVPSASNIPESRWGAASCTDGSGSFWLFGGIGPNDVTNDLWEFNPTAKTWTWVSGSSTPASIYGVYGTKGVASVSNFPGSRYLSVSWIDSAGNFWLFGGNVPTGNLNDLWEYNPTNKTWTWVSGSSAGDPDPGYPTGVYGTKGVPSAANVPGGRYSAVSWTDSSGNLWLFGGEADTYPGQYLNDLWEFSPTTKMWTWMGGGNASYSVAAVYGTQGVAAVTNVPGARGDAISRADNNGNLWLFGGYGFDANGNQGSLNDLWEYKPSSNAWIWVSGSTTISELGVYGTQGVPAATNIPGNRLRAVGWIDSSSDFWLFGGQGGDSSSQDGLLNDLWRYQP